jgi:hypothetical protein
MTTTATIETLTAEVRTLVVGSRQITMSVAKQLDIVPIDQLRVFGRVRISTDDVSAGYVIGADEQGTLALARFYKPAMVEFLSKSEPELLDMQALHEAAAAAPLIVLAGLR